MTCQPDVLVFSRRAALLAPVLLLVATGVRAQESAEVRIDVGRTDGVPFRREDMGIVGVYDVDLLLRPEFTRMLDIFAASPGAFSGVRFSGSSRQARRSCSNRRAAARFGLIRQGSWISASRLPRSRPSPVAD